MNQCARAVPSSQLRVNESCSASVKTDLLRRLRRLNQGQRRALRVEPASRCSYGMCRMPLDGPPTGLRSGEASRTSAAASIFYQSRGDLEKGRGMRSVSGGIGSARRRGWGGCYVFPCGHNFHEFCLGASGEGWRRGSEGEAGDGAPACSICSKRKTITR